MKSTIRSDGAFLFLSVFVAEEDAGIDQSDFLRCMIQDDNVKHIPLLG
jgi:hypothetical protein